MTSYNRRYFLKQSSFALALSALLASESTDAIAKTLAPEISELPPWTPGQLDIHHISTGRGSCAFMVCPDATTLMIDAGSTLSGIDPTRDKYLIDPRPNGSLRPGQWIAKYVQPYLVQANRQEIDYFLLTHFHVDHMGEIAPGNLEVSPRSKFGNYQLGGLTDVAEVIKIDTIIDRNYPDYNYPVPHTDAQDKNYQAFGKSFLQRGGKIERIVPGSAGQIKLTQNANQFPTFSVRNLAANGEVWTGAGEETRKHFPPLSSLSPKDYPTENKCSLAIRLAYGKFRYFSAGDMDHEIEYGHLPWGDIEAIVARASGPVDIAVADHHGWADACGPDWVRALRAKVYVINAWDSAHPTIVSLSNMLSTELYPGARMVFATAMKPENVIATRRIAELASQNGHVIFRVAAGGDSYEIFVRDSSREFGKIVAHFGPFLCG
jgi:beta-lactamase superfamily II metal-dependent hydrolase